MCMKSLILASCILYILSFSLFAVVISQHHTSFFFFLRRARKASRSRERYYQITLRWPSLSEIILVSILPSPSFPSPSPLPSPLSTHAITSWPLQDHWHLYILVPAHPSNTRAQMQRRVMYHRQRYSFSSFSLLFFSPSTSRNLTPTLQHRSINQPPNKIRRSSWLYIFFLVNKYEILLCNLHQNQLGRVVVHLIQLSYIGHIER